MVSCKADAVAILAHVILHRGSTRLIEIMSAVFGFTTIIAILGMKDVPRIAIMTRTTANARTAAEIAEAFFCNLAHIPPGVELVYIFDDTERDRTFGMCLEETLRTHRLADRAKGAAAPALPGAPRVGG